MEIGGQVAAMQAERDAASAIGNATARATENITKPLALQSAWLSFQNSKYETLGKVAAAIRGAISEGSKPLNQALQKGFFG